MHKNLCIWFYCCIFASEKETKTIKPQDPEGQQDYDKDFSKRNDSNRLHG